MERLVRITLQGANAGGGWGKTPAGEAREGRRSGEGDEGSGVELGAGEVAEGSEDEVGVASSSSRASVCVCVM